MSYFFAIIILTFIMLIIFSKKTSNIVFYFFKFTDSSLSHQWPFRLSLAIPFFFAGFLCLPLWFDPKITFDLSSSGYQKFLELFKLPIGILSLSIPLVAIVAHIHRTIQTSVQINETKKKNIADGFFSHHKFITEALSKLPSLDITINEISHVKKITSPYSLYKKMFKFSSYENGFSMEGLTDFLKNTKNLITHMDELIESTKNENLSQLFSIFEDLISSTSDLNIELELYSFNKKSENNNLFMFKENDTIFKISFRYKNELELKNDIKTTFELVVKILELTNTEFEIPDNIYFYAYSNTQSNNRFSEIFDNSISYNGPESIGFSRSSSTNNEMKILYLKYLHTKKAK
ncbi:hypothetical protein [Hafnia alvei]|uniref:hypothetical protein n=1 Tax=Hafnia alvei TaxID=569 RepID=UPI00141364B2|nr:hypothetical protein [Hafnia alvei]QIP55412.1 hypothetical protein HBA19_07225 [Hafnia alvei]